MRGLLFVASSEYVHPSAYLAVSAALGVSPFEVAPYVVRTKFEGARWVAWVREGAPEDVAAAGGVQFSFDGLKTTVWFGVVHLVAYPRAPSSAEVERARANPRKMRAHELPDGDLRATVQDEWTTFHFGREVITPLDTLALLRQPMRDGRFKVRYLTPDEAAAAPSANVPIRLSVSVEQLTAGGAPLGGLTLFSSEEHDCYACDACGKACSRLCAGCSRAAYCDATCAGAAWGAHKAACRAHAQTA